jgi:nicotinamidase-related amidase
MSKTMRISQPAAGTRRALMVIDVQPATLTHDGARDMVAVIHRYIEKTSYDAYVIARFSAPDGSMFARQLKWVLPADAAGPSDPTIIEAVMSKGKPVTQVAKTVRSVFKAQETNGVKEFLDRCAIDEVHLVGFDINDCVLATAYDALDQGYLTFAIEECCGRTDWDRSIIDAALLILRKQAMTNNSNRFRSIELAL